MDRKPVGNITAENHGHKKNYEQTIDPGPWSNVYSSGKRIGITLTKVDIMNSLTIGKLAKNAGVTNDTVRFYERYGLIEPVSRSESNYRLYKEEDAARLRFIKRAKTLGFTLNEIKELLALSHDPHATKADIKMRTEQKADDIRQKIADLSRILSALEHLVEICDGHGSLKECPILKSLTDDR